MSDPATSPLGDMSPQHDARCITLLLTVNTAEDFEVVMRRVTAAVVSDTNKAILRAATFQGGPEALEEWLHRVAEGEQEIAGRTMVVVKEHTGP